GPSAMGVGIVQSLLDALTCALITKISLKHWGVVAAWMVGLIAVIYRPMIFFSAPILKESLVLLLLTVFVFFCLQAFTRKRSRDFIFAGLALGLTALTRGNILLLAPAFVLILFLRWRKEALIPAITFAAFTVIAILPATIHNFTASHDFVPTS